MNTAENYFLNKQFKCPIILINQHIEPFGDNYVVRCDQEPGVWEMFEMDIRNNPGKKQEKVHIIPSNLNFRKTL